MRLLRVRNQFTEKSAIGPVFVENFSLNPSVNWRDLVRWWMLESPSWPDHRQTTNLVDGSTAIPPGLYDIILVRSPKRRYIVPLLVAVPGRTEIEIHIGNLPKDTTGCLLIGETAQTDFIGNSTIAFRELVHMLLDEEFAGRRNSIEIVEDRRAG